jgi:hypothetical protein
MKALWSAFFGALGGVVAGSGLILFSIKQGILSPAAMGIPVKSRNLEEISPRFKADIDRKITTMDAGYEPYQSPRDRAAELRAILDELLSGPLTEHEARKIAQRMGAEIEVLAFDAEHIIQTLRPTPSFEANETSGE